LEPEYSVSASRVLAAYTIEAFLSVSDLRCRRKIREPKLTAQLVPQLTGLLWYYQMFA
jgi:hypothetical protein